MFTNRVRAFDAPMTLAEFQKPPARFGLAPFWFWNGDMNEQSVREQVRAMSAAGVSGFFIHPRQGLTLPYLSNEFFGRVRVAVEEAAAAGMEAWLYDEFPYPSGIAGGMLTANHPEMRARLLEHHSHSASSGEVVRWELPLGRAICALAVPMIDGAPDWANAVDIRDYLGVVLTRDELWIWPMGHIPYNEKRFMSDEGALVLDWTAPSSSGEWHLVVGLEREQRGFKYFDVWFDPLHPEAAPRFLELTHERYAHSVGEWFGTTIPGIFTDEIEPPHWSPHLERAIDFDWSRTLPALWDSSFPDADAIRLRLRETALSLFKQRWEQPIADWCQQHNLVWCAEKPTYRPSQMDLIEQPSTDAGHRRVDLGPEKLPLDLRANGRVAMAVAEQNGGCEVRCECFHSLGWGATLQDQKWSIDWLGATGVNRFTPHAFYFSSSGLRKFDAAPSFFEENPYWQHFHLLADYTARLGLALSRGREVAPVAVLYPTRRLWSRSKPDEERWVELMNALLEAHMGFHVVDAPTITRGVMQEDGFAIGRARYETLVVPPFDEGDVEIEAAIEAARRAHMRVIEGESITQTIASLKSDKRLYVRDEVGNELTQVWALYRETPRTETEAAQNIVFLANTSAETVQAQLTVICEAKHWGIWSLESGASAPCSYFSPNALVNQFQLELPPFASLLLIGQGAEQGTLPVATPKQTLLLDTSGEWSVTRDEPNALRLNRWKVAAGVADGAAELDDSQWKQIEAMPLFHRDKRVGLDVEPLPHSIGESVWYRRTIDSEIRPDEIELLIEDGAIGGQWSAYLNGELLPSSAFSPRALHGRDKIACSLAHLWREGSNTLAICVREGAPHRERGGLRVPLHLIGNFGVATSVNGERRLVEPAATSSLFDLDGAHLPHFAGTTRFSKRFAANSFESFDTLTLAHKFEDIVAVRLNGHELGVRAWSPYEWALPPLGESGEVEVEIAVTNTLLRFLEGRVWNAVTGEKRSV
ncbi:hypothetical protein EON83_25645 [bacterium]|nr:MAG: hypothetical protein EON83_25645 [bacterium]